MKNNNSQNGLGDVADILLVCANFLFGFLIIYFIIIIIVPLFGERAVPLKNLVPFAYWTGYYFVARYFLKHMKSKTKLKNYQYWLIGLYHSSLVLRIPPPYSYIIFILFFVFFMKVINREVDSWNIDTTVGQATPNKSLERDA